MGIKHSKLGPSGAVRWMNCTASVGHNQTNGRYSTNAAAEEGTAGHTVLEYRFYCAGYAVPTDPEKLEAEVQRISEVVEYNFTEMVRHAEIMVEYVRLISDRLPDAEISIEGKVSIPQLSPDIWGTADCIVWIPSMDELHIIDYKYGFNPVEPNSPQLILYLLGALSRLKLIGFPKRMVATIIQPRRRTEGRPDIVSHEPTRDELIDFIEMVKKAVDEIENGPVFRPSEKACQYCSGMAACPEIIQMAHKACEFANLDAAVPSYEESLEMIPLVRKWCDVTEEAAIDHIKIGMAIPGWELKPGTSRRKWVNEEQVLEFLTKEKRIPLKLVAPRKLAGIPAIEKVISGKKNVDKGQLAAYISKPPGKLKLSRAKANPLMTDIDIEEDQK